MFLIYANAAIGVLVMILFWLVCINSAHEFKSRYPMLTVKRSHWSGKVLSLIQISVSALVPLLNLVLAYVLIFKSNEVIEMGVSKLYKKCTDEVTDI